MVRISTPNLGLSDRMHVQMNLDSIHIDFDPRSDEHDSTTAEITHVQAHITESGLKGCTAQVLSVQKRGPHWSIILALNFDKAWDNYSAGNYGALELEIRAQCTSKKTGKSSIDAKGKVNFVI